MASPWISTSAFCLAAIGLGVNIGGVQDEISPNREVSGLDAHETHAAASLLGQFRSTISGNLWVRADLYLHNGVQMRPLTEAEAKAGHEGSKSNDGLHEHLDGGDNVTTVIPGSHEDFRGVLGDVERATKAYKDMTVHSHNSPEQSLPLFRLMTWMDPTFIPGWTTGAHIVAMQGSKQAAGRAVAFLEQGLEHNPDSPSLNNQLGFTYIVRLKDFRNGMIAFQRAIEAARPFPLEKLTEDDRDAILAAYRWLALAYRTTGRLEDMAVLIKDGLTRFPEDVPLKRIGEWRPYPLQPNDQELKRVSTEEMKSEQPNGMFEHDHEQDHSHDHDHDHQH